MESAFTFIKIVCTRVHCVCTPSARRMLQHEYRIRRGVIKRRREIARDRTKMRNQQENERNGYNNDTKSRGRRLILLDDIARED